MPPKRRAARTSEDAPRKRTKTAAAGTAAADGLDPQIVGFFASPFLGVEDVSEDINSGCDLTDHHPLFARNKFPGVRWGPLSTPAKLASKLMGAKGLRELFHVALVRDPRKRPRKYRSKAKYKYGYPDFKTVVAANPLTAAAVGDIAQALVDLEPMIRFEASDTVDSWVSEADHAITNPGHRYFGNGVGTTIRYPQRLYDGLRAARSTGVDDDNDEDADANENEDADADDDDDEEEDDSEEDEDEEEDDEKKDDDKGDDDEEDDEEEDDEEEDDDEGRLDWPLLRTLEFNFAVSMIHEILHAFYNARLPVNADWDPFFGSAAISEVGFEAEYRLFGGHVCPLFDMKDDAEHEISPYRLDALEGDEGRPLSTARGVMVMWEWPERGIVDLYKELHTIDCYKARLPKIDLAWRLPLWYFTQLFTTAFWVRYDADATGVLLHPPKETGYFFEAGGGDRVPCKPNDVGLVPGGYRKIDSDTDHTIVKL